MTRKRATKQNGKLTRHILLKKKYKKQTGQIGFN